MKVIGISPLDKDATVSVVEDGRILFAASEERYSRVKLHAGFPYNALKDALRITGTSPEEVEAVYYAFFDAAKEHSLKTESMLEEAKHTSKFRHKNLQSQIREAKSRVPDRSQKIPGLADPNATMRKGAFKSLTYRLLGGSSAFSHLANKSLERKSLQESKEAHEKWERELETGLKEFGLLEKLKRREHHLSHAANSFYASGFDRALIVTLDGYGSGLAASVSVGDGNGIKRLQSIRYPNSLGEFYEQVTSSLGFRPSRHEGKIVGLAAYGDPNVLSPILKERIESKDGSYRIREAMNIYFSRYLAGRFAKIDVAAAYQNVLEMTAAELTSYWIEKTGCDAVVLSGGVVANVKMNQRIYEVSGVNRLFVYPNMGDGGCASGLALHATRISEMPAFESAYLGPSFTADEVKSALEAENLKFSKPDNLAAEVAQLIHEEHVVARFDGRMEYGPRALGNRSILYHTRDPEVNQWLNHRLGRTEFMPFAPVTLWEARERCYKNIKGAEFSAQFMTVTFDCTDEMKAQSPAAVHIDGTARPQLIKESMNPGYYAILSEYEKLSGIPSLVNTSFNMHEEPIVCSPEDAVRAFLQGNLDYLVAGPFLVPHPRLEKEGKVASQKDRSNA